MRAKLIALALTVALAFLAGAPALALAGGGDVEGACVGGPSEWRLRVSGTGDAALRVRFEIGHGDEGQEWQLFISDNGQRIFAGSRTSAGGGQVRVRVLTSDLPRRDRIKATGANVATGESCSASIRY
jgi:hypothetical protein